MALYFKRKKLGTLYAITNGAQKNDGFTSLIVDGQNDQNSKGFDCNVNNLKSAKINFFSCGQSFKFQCFQCIVCDYWIFAQHSKNEI